MFNLVAPKCVRFSITIFILMRCASFDLAETVGETISGRINYEIIPCT